MGRKAKAQIHNAGGVGALSHIALKNSNFLVVQPEISFFSLGLGQADPYLNALRKRDVPVIHG